MRSIICALIVVSILSVSGVAQDCSGGTCNKPVRQVVSRVVQQPVQFVTGTTQRVVKATRSTARRTFGWLRRGSCCN